MVVQEINPGYTQGPNVVYIGQGGPKGTQGVQGPQGPAGSGTQGATGTQGTQGIQGSAGLGASVENFSYTHNQGSASDTWNITHNLNFYPNVTVQDSGGTIVEGEINYTTRNTLIVTFSSAFSGKAYLS